MKITNVQATIHRVPVTPLLVKKPMERNFVIARIDTDQGITGWGLSSLTDGFALREFINAELAPFLTGKDPMNTEGLWNEMYWTFNQRSLSGVVSHGMSAVDIAVWDIKGKFLNQPVWRILGGYSATVPAYITFGLPEYSVAELVQAAVHYVNEGQDKLKMVVAIDHGRKVAEDAARVRAVREAVGEDVQLMMDANHVFDFLSAYDLCRRVEPYNLTWFEEPVRGNDVMHLRALHERTSVPLSAGQNEGFRFRHREFMLNQAVDIIQPNVCSVGGYTEAVKVAHMAQAFNLPIANGGGWPHHNAHLMAAVANGWRVEFHAQMWLIGEAIYHDPPRPVNGWVTLPERPGLGLEPKEDVLKTYLVP